MSDCIFLVVPLIDESASAVRLQLIQAEVSDFVSVQSENGQI